MTSSGTAAPKLDTAGVSTKVPPRTSYRGINYFLDNYLKLQAVPGKKIRGIITTMRIIFTCVWAVKQNDVRGWAST